MSPLSVLCVDMESKDSLAHLTTTLEWLRRAPRIDACVLDGLVVRYHFAGRMRPEVKREKAGHR